MTAENFIRQSIIAAEYMSAREWLLLYGDGKTSPDELKEHPLGVYKRKPFEARRAKQFLVSGCLKAIRGAKR